MSAGNEWEATDWSGPGYDYEPPKRYPSKQPRKKQPADRWVRAERLRVEPLIDTGDWFSDNT